jgi:hypothetical protein
VNPEEKNRAESKNAPEREELSPIKHLLRQAMPPVPPVQLEPRTDLWPQLRAHIDSQLAADRSVNVNRTQASARIRIPWFDWTLAALAAAALLFFPGIIPALLYHF